MKAFQGLFGGGHGGHNGQTATQAPAVATGAIDPVSRNPVDPARALSSAYGGLVYYFESAETRNKFEATPSSYAARQPEPQPARRQHGGCC
jgi:YHS domain-containing protein